MLIRAAVVGRPIEHSLSPALHLAAYTALGLEQHRYERVDVGAGELAGFVAGLDQNWCGLSVTMPGKEEALALADSAGTDARLTGAANTLLRREGSWHAENTDVLGVVAALGSAGISDLSAVENKPSGAASPGERCCIDLIGSGATARSALVALHRLGASQVRVIVRDQTRSATAALAEKLGVRLQPMRTEHWLTTPGRIGLVINTVPARVAPVDTPAGVGAHSVLFDVNYAPWPTGLARHAAARGARIVGGGEMLLQQAMAQVSLMTGRSAPEAAMRAALDIQLPPDPA